MLQRRFDPNLTNKEVIFQASIAMALPGGPASGAMAFNRMRSDHGHWALLLSLHDALALKVFRCKEFHYLICHEASRSFVWILHRWPGAQLFELAEPEQHRSPRVAQEEALLSLALHAAQPPARTHSSVLEEFEQRVTLKFNALLDVLSVMDSPRAISDSAHVTPDGEAAEDTADPTVILPNWSVGLTHDSTQSEQLNAVTTENTEGSRRSPSPKTIPFVNVKTAGTRAEALVDTGASVCVVRADFLLKAYGEAWVRANVRHEKNAPYIMLADGSTSATTGFVDLTFAFGDDSTTFLTSCWVFPQAAYGLILGAKFMSDFGVNVLMGRRELSFDGRDALRVPFVGCGPPVHIQMAPKVVAACDLWLHPGQEALIDAVVPHGPPTDEAGSWGLLAPDPTLMTPNALLANGPTLIKADGKTKALVGNFTDTSTLVRVGMPLGLFSLANADDFLSMGLTQSDPHFKKELQEALNEAVVAGARADAELAPMYFDQLATPTARAAQPSLPDSLDLASALCANEQERAQLRQTLLVSRVHSRWRWSSWSGTGFRIPDRPGGNRAAATHARPPHSPAVSCGGYQAD